jgi:hypothetical protein
MGFLELHRGASPVILSSGKLPDFNFKDAAEEPSFDLDPAEADRALKHLKEMLTRMESLPPTLAEAPS